VLLIVLLMQSFKTRSEAVGRFNVALFDRGGAAAVGV
jgi:hypothetical protein